MLDRSCPSCPSVSVSKGWLIVLLMFLADALCLGGRSLFIVVMIYWQDEFGWSRKDLGALIALVHIINGLTTPLSGHLVDSFPHHWVIGGGLGWLALSFALTSIVQETWQIWLFYGVICGTAYGLLNMNVFVVAVTRNIPKKQQGLAIGVATAGSTFGQFALVPIFVLIADNYGWRAGYASLAICTVLLIPPSVYLLYTEPLPPPLSTAPSPSFELALTSDSMSDDNGVGLQKENLKECHEAVEVGEIIVIEEVEGDREGEGQGKGKGKGDDSIIKDNSGNNIFLARLFMLFSIKQYWCLTFVFVICGITTTGFLETHLVALAVDRGEDIREAALSFSVLSACNGLAMVISGLLTDKVDRHCLLACIFAIRCLAYLLLFGSSSADSSSDQTTLLFVFAACFGFVDYSVVPPVCSLVKTFSEDAETEFVGLGVGVLLLWHSLGAAVGSFMGGIVYSEYNQYDPALLSCSSLCLVAALVCVLMTTCGGGKVKKSIYDNDECQSKSHSSYYTQVSTSQTTDTDTDISTNAIELHK